MLTLVIENILGETEINEVEFTEILLIISNQDIIQLKIPMDKVIFMKSFEHSESPVENVRDRVEFEVVVALFEHVTDTLTKKLDDGKILVFDFPLVI